MKRITGIFLLIILCMSINIAYADSEVSFVTDSKTYNDYSYDNQWYLSKLGVNKAWALGYEGSSDVIVAVVDSGYDRDCDDFDYSRIYGAWDFTEDQSGLGEGDTIANGGHGTFIVNMIGAISGNGTGTAGITSNVKIMPVKVSDTLTFDTSKLVEGINYAVENGADIINISAGGTTDDSDLYEACKNAVEQGCIVIAAAGNDGSTVKKYPAAYDEVIGVGGADTDGSLWTDSNRGDNVFVLAYSKYVGAYSNQNTVNFIAGTSIAVPQVTALAALLKSKNSSLDQEEFMDILKNSSSGQGVKSEDTGYGIINYVDAIRYMNGTKAFGSVSVPSTMSYVSAKNKSAVTVKSPAGNKVTLGKSYTVTYANGLKCGKTKVTVKGMGNYEDVVSKYTVIRPAQAKISSLSSSSGLTVIKVASQYSTGITGYQVKYKRSGTSTWYTTYLTGNNTKKTFKKLKKGKTYYFKVRAYVKVNDIKYIGPYSSSKKVKVK